MENILKEGLLRPYGVTDGQIKKRAIHSFSVLDLEQTRAMVRGCNSN